MPLARAIGQAIFKRMAPELASAGEMIRTAKRLGGTYRKTEMLADIREITHRFKYQNSIKGLSGNKVVPRAWMVETSLKEPGANYRVYGEGQFYDWKTGKEYNKVVSFYHTDLTNKDNYETEFDDYFKDKYQKEDIEVISFNQTGMDHNVGKPY